MTLSRYPGSLDNFSLNTQNFHFMLLNYCSFIKTIVIKLSQFGFYI